jgi:hypothetical protein
MMARQSRPARSNEIKQSMPSIDTYFEKVSCPITLGGNFAIKGIAAAVSMDSNTHFIITAPNWEILRRVWAKIESLPLVEKKAMIVCEALIGQFDYSATEPRPPIQKQTEVDIWIYHPESDCIFIGTRKELEMDLCLLELGEAIQQTEIECKTILRKLRWPRTDIEDVEISTIKKEDIPF